MPRQLPKTTACTAYALIWAALFKEPILVLMAVIAGVGIEVQTHEAVSYVRYLRDTFLTGW
jgi:hypothetical protein